MQNKRWYEKNEILQQLMIALENTDSDTQNDIANDIIQLVINKQYNFDDFIHALNNQSPSVKNRWYDKNETLHSAIEMLKNIDENEQKELFIEILETILNFNNEKVLKALNFEDSYN